MKKIVNKFSVVCLIFVLFFQLALPAYAASVSSGESSGSNGIGLFTDIGHIKPGTENYNAIQHLFDLGFFEEYEVDKFRPFKIITAREWAAMVCRALDYDIDVSGDSCVLRGAEEGWLSESAAACPDESISRGDMATGIMFILRSLYPDFALFLDGITVCSEEYADTILAVGLGFINAPAHCTIQYVAEHTRENRLGAAKIIYKLLTFGERTEEYAFLTNSTAVRFSYDGNGILSSFLSEIALLPKDLLELFNKQGWGLHIDKAGLASAVQQSKANGTLSLNVNEDSVNGLFLPSLSTIFVSSHKSLVHEFGHFLNHSLNRPAYYHELYRLEAQAAVEVLGTYAASNYSEYFAECFEFWLHNRKDSELMNSFRAIAPMTYEYFADLEAHNWGL